MLSDLTVILGILGIALWTVFLAVILLAVRYRAQLLAYRLEQAWRRVEKRQDVVVRRIRRDQLADLRRFASPFGLLPELADDPPALVREVERVTGKPVSDGLREAILYEPKTFSRAELVILSYPQDEERPDYIAESLSVFPGRKYGTEHAPGEP